jgi:transcriptional regulator with XRE-family HTH domain
MTHPESPAGARRRVRLALREARLAMKLTQGEVAEAMEWSQSKVIRIESGEVTISPNDLRPLLGHLGITGKAATDLLQDARAARRRQMWWDEPRFREHLTNASRQLVQYELEAVAARYFTNIMIPGRLQNDAYAAAVLHSYQGEGDLSPEAAAALLDARKRRHTELIGRRSFPETQLLLDEAVLHRRIGSAQIASDQLLELLRLSRVKPLSIRILPFTSEPPPPAIGPFEILILPATGADAVLYRESHINDEIVDDPKNVGRHLAIFEQYWHAALDESTTAHMIEENAKKLAESGPASSTPTVSPPARSRAAKTAKAAMPRSRRRPPS